MPPGADVLSELMRVIQSRQRDPQPRSYTCQLLEEGWGKIAEKVREEAEEAIEAAAEPGDAGRQHLVREAADLTYHLLVLLAHAGVDWQQVASELSNRFGISGLDEKAART